MSPIEEIIYEVDLVLNESASYPPKKDQVIELMKLIEQRRIADSLGELMKLIHAQAEE